MDSTGPILCSQCACSVWSSHCLKNCTREINGQQRIMFNKIVNINHNQIRCLCSIHLYDYVYKNIWQKLHWKVEWTQVRGPEIVCLRSLLFLRCIWQVHKCFGSEWNEWNCLLSQLCITGSSSYLHQLVIHSEDFYNAHSRKLFRGSLSPATAKEKWINKF